MNENLNLNAVEWGEFYFYQIFSTIQRGKRLIKQNQKAGKIPYISSSGENNGVDNFISNEEGVRKFKECISLANSGSVGSAFFHSYKFIGSDHITSLSNKKFNKYIYLFLLPLIKRLAEKYSFNREINDPRIKREKILLPKDSQRNPNYEFMEKFMKQIEQKQIQTQINNITSKLAQSKPLHFDTSTIQWKEFKLSQFFKNYHGKRLVEKDRIYGNTPLLTAGESSNGVASFIDNQQMTIYKDFISIDMFGNAFYHAYSATGDDNIYFFVNDDLSQQIKLFIVACINMQKSKYSYGKQFRQPNADNARIMLPTDSNGNPHYEFMEKYMRNLEQIQLKKALDYYERLKS